MNEHPEQERVVLHVDFFNTLTMTPIEIEIMQYIYSLREEFMKAEGMLWLDRSCLAKIIPLWSLSNPLNSSSTCFFSVEGVAKVGKQIL
jgi:hypothetical protein